MGDVCAPHDRGRLLDGSIPGDEQFVDAASYITPNSNTAPRHFAQALVWLRISTLVVRIGYHIAFMAGLGKGGSM
jgi:hypothetical protein